MIWVPWMATPLQSGRPNHRGVGWLKRLISFFFQKNTKNFLVGFAFGIGFFCFVFVWFLDCFACFVFDVFWVSCVVFVFFFTFKANGKLAKTPKPLPLPLLICMQEAFRSAAKGVATYASSGGSWWHCPKYPQSSHFCARTQEVQ